MSNAQSPSRGGEVEPWSRRLLRTALGLLVPALAVLALIPSAAGAATSGTLTGSFTVPPGTHDPADVNIQLVDRSGAPVPLGPGAVTILDTSSTSASFTVTGIDPGQYYVYFYDRTPVDNVAPDYYGDGGVDNIGGATVVTVPVTGGSQSLTAQTLRAGATVTGTVSDANLAAETVAHVTATPSAATLLADPMLTGVRTVVIGGVYAITGLPGAGFYLSYDATGSEFSLSGIYVSAAGVSYDLGSATQYRLALGGSTTANFAVPAVGGIGGRVTDAAGAPLFGVPVYAYDAAGNMIPASSTTAVDGSYTISDVLPGSYEVEFGPLRASNLAGSFYGGSNPATDTRVTVAGNVTTPNINGTLTAGATISGSVTAAQGGAPLGGIVVRAVDEQGSTMAETTSNADGTYTLANVSAGTWYLEFVGGLAYNGRYYATGYYLGRGKLGGALPIKVAPAASLTGLSEALLAESPTLPGLPKVSLGRLGGLATNRVGISFRLTAGSGPAGYLRSFSIKLPRYVSWNRAALGRDIEIPKVTFTYVIRAGRLVITLPTGERLVNFRIKSGGIRVGRALQRLAGQRRIASQTIGILVTDTTGKVSSTSYRVRRPH